MVDTMENNMTTDNTQTEDAPKILPCPYCGDDVNVSEKEAQGYTTFKALRFCGACYAADKL